MHKHICEKTGTEFRCRTPSIELRSCTYDEITGCDFCYDNSSLMRDKINKKELYINKIMMCEEIINKFTEKINKSFNNKVICPHCRAMIELSNLSIKWYEDNNGFIDCMYCHNKFMFSDRLKTCLKL